jgi:transposase
MVEFRGDTIELTFNKSDFMERPTINQPFIPTVHELRLGIVDYCKINNPRLLECKVEHIITEAGHSIIWTPPYTPELQPIELFWGIGKNYAANKNSNTSRLKDVVTSLRDGWYGNNYIFDDNIENIDITTGLLILNNKIIWRKEPVDCCRLFDHVIKQANKKYIKICDGIEGTIGNLIVDDNHQQNMNNMPIDILLNFVQPLLEVEEEEEIESENNLQEV